MLSEKVKEELKIIAKNKLIHYGYNGDKFDVVDIKIHHGDTYSAMYKLKDSISRLDVVHFKISKSELKASLDNIPLNNCKSIW